jgi:hypothetical protein
MKTTQDDAMLDALTAQCNQSNKDTHFSETVKRTV